MKQLKEIQKEHSVPIMLVAQLNRSVEGKQDKAPTMADIRESGSIEEIADLIIFPHRPAYFNREQQEEEIHDVELIIAKNRNGFVGTLPFQFVKKQIYTLKKEFSTMTILELYTEAKKDGVVSVWLLIEYLVFERKVLTFEDRVNGLDYYFEFRFRHSMNQYLKKYMRKRNIAMYKQFLEVEGYMK